MKFFEYLNYEHGQVLHNYYTGRVRNGLGICAADMMQHKVMLQVFPWPDDTTEGHRVYAQFLSAKSTTTAAQEGRLFTRYPFEMVDADDILMIKCAIEEMINNTENTNGVDQSVAADTAAGKVVE